MTKAHHDVHIDRPIDEVFDFLADGTNNHRWQPFVDGATAPDGPPGIGRTFHQRARHPLGFTVSADYRIAAYERPRLLVLVVTSGGPVRPTVTYQLTPAGDGTADVRCTVEYHPSGLGRLAGPVLGLLHPLFAWEASSIERARTVLNTVKGPTVA
jgi:uncharacterized protein YndB with AHSA1/START domain